MMNSGRDINTIPLSHKPSSAAHSSPHPARSPPRNTISPPPKPLSRSTPRRSRESAASRTNRIDHGDDASKTNGNIDSDAETIILSGDDERNRPKNRIKKLASDNMRSSQSPPPLTSMSDPARSIPPSRRSSLNGAHADKQSRPTNGVDKPNHNGDSHPKRPEGRKRSGSRSRNETSDRAQSAEASLSRSSVLSDSDSAKNSSDRDRKAVSVEPRKRKFSDENQKSKLEPPRQRPRLDSSAKASPRLKHRAISPPSPSGPDVPTHRRSGSLQSATTRGSGRRKRDASTNSHASEDKYVESEDSADESSTTFSRPPALLPPRSNRTNSRALASPARTSSLPTRRADKYGTTPLARYCEKGQLDQVKIAYEQAPEELDQEDNGGFAPLQKAALRGHLQVVKFLLEKGCRRDCCSKEAKDTPLIDAVENNHVEVVKILLEYGVNPHHANKSGVRAIDAVDEDAKGAEEISELLKEAMANWQNSEPEADEATQESPVLHRRERGTGSLRPDLLYHSHTKETLLKYSTNGDLEAVGMFLESVVPDNACIVAAARGGHDAILSLLLASAPEVDKDPDPQKYDETPLLAAIGRSNTKVIRLLLEQDNFNPCRKTRDGKTYYEVAEERRGPRWQTEVELLKDRYDSYKSSKLARRKRLQEAKASGKFSNAKDVPGPNSPKMSKTKLVKTERLDDETKTKRLSAGKDIASKEFRRKRHIIEDDSSGSSDETSGIVPKVMRHKRTNSTSSKPGTLEKSKNLKGVRRTSDEHTKLKPGRKPKDKTSQKTAEQDSDIEMGDSPANASAASRPTETVSSHRTKPSVGKDKIRKRNDSQTKEQNATKKAQRLEAEERRLIREEEAKARKEERQKFLDSVPECLAHAMSNGSNRSDVPIKEDPDAPQIHSTGDPFTPVFIFHQHEVDPSGYEAVLPLKVDPSTGDVTIPTENDLPGFEVRYWVSTFHNTLLLKLPICKYVSYIGSL